MQTNKIKIGEIYAVKAGGKYSRFSVTKIETSRTMAGSNTVIVGRLLDVENTPADRSFDPADVIGPYEDVAELAAKREAEKAEAKAKDDQWKSDCQTVRFWLYRACREKVPTLGKYDYKEPFRVSYGGIEITREGIDLLLKTINAPALALVEKKESAQ